ncbi:MAG TPA: hypothetical protein DCE44_23775 [Verrucomicrobiales bacterium]|nr:hypothetical protein [Verrucomicrobiales bacterium]
MVIGTLYLSQGSAVQFAGFNFQPTRILGYLCLIRVLVRGELSFARLHRIDRILLVLYIYTTLILLIRPDENRALRLAKLMDVLSVYLSFRALIRSPDEWRWFLKIFALLLVPYVMILAVESSTRRNLFGWVGALDKIWMRGTKIRCLGSFRHPSLLGSVGACFFPMFVALARERSNRMRGILGAVLCVMIVGFSNSGGPLSVFMVSVAGWAMWPMRTKMQLFRRGLVAFLAVLAMVMKAPIWYLLARLSAVTGGTGWHRSYLIDVAIRNIDRWWLVGLPLSETSTWFPYVIAATGGADITNQFIAFGLQGGLLAIILFFILLYFAFSDLGRALAKVRNSYRLAGEEGLLWALGVALAAHISNWLGITYFDQFNVLWLLHLAALVSICEYFMRAPAPQYSFIEEDFELQAGPTLNNRSSRPAGTN